MPPWASIFFFYYHLTLAGFVEYTSCLSAEGLHHSHVYPGYDITQSDGKALVVLKFWGMQSTLSLALLPGPLWPRVVVSDKVLSMGQIELFDI